MAIRLVVVGVLLLAMAGARPLYVGRRRRLVEERPAHPLVPARLLAPGTRTWLVFTTPYCASCDPVVASITAADREARVVKVDATEEVALASAFSVRTAPTVLLSDDCGQVQARLVGPPAVQAYLSSAYLRDCQTVVDQS